jgi:hypothetical protein
MQQTLPQQEQEVLQQHQKQGSDILESAQTPQKPAAGTC